jgi:hypothetical protein
MKEAMCDFQLFVNLLHLWGYHSSLVETSGYHSSLVETSGYHSSLVETLRVMMIRHRHPIGLIIIRRGNLPVYGSPWKPVMIATLVL